MHKADVESILARDPFVPVRLHLSNGKTFDVPFRDVARVLSYAVLVFIGLKERTRQAKGYDRFTFEQIERIEELPHGKSRRRKKAS
jgi:hypothetical protein